MSPGVFDRFLDVREETSAELQLRHCLNDIFDGKTHIERVIIAGQLIEFSRSMQTALAAVRRDSTVAARSAMSPGQISETTGLSKATVSRLITEYRNL